MREILFRGKTGLGKWIQGDLLQYLGSQIVHIAQNYTGAGGQEVVPETVGQYTDLTDKNGKKIFEGDIIQYLTFDGFDCQSVVKFGEYKQDGSDGEYKASDCLGFYVEVDNFTCPDWCDNEPERFHDYLKQQGLAEVSSQCEIIGNICDNPELLDINQ